MTRVSEPITYAGAGVDVEAGDKAVALTVELIEGCDACGVTLVRPGKSMDSPAYTHDAALHGDRLQYELQEGPCMDAVWEHDIVISSDLEQDRRWPQWGPRVVSELGVRSMMCVQLFTDSKPTLGSLNLYSWNPHAFTMDGDRNEGLALGAHVAVALVAAQEIEGLTTALSNRTTIGQAEGILMERFGISPERAFQVLRRVSSHSNTKLHAVAAELVDTRKLPGQGG